MWEYNNLIDAIVERMIGVLGRERAVEYAGVPITSQGRFAVFGVAAALVAGPAKLAS